MHYSQKALIFNRAEFEFRDKSLEVTIDDGRLRVGFTVPYHEIGTKRSIKSFPEKAIPRLGYALLFGALTGALLTGGDFGGLSETLYVVCLLLGFVLVITRRYARFDATRIPLATGNTILVFQDSMHHIILGEIYKRRKADIIRLHGEVDALNHPQLELKKFLWLKEENIISEHEFEEARLKIATLSKTPAALY